MIKGDPWIWARFVMAALAAWRIAHLLAEEDGPFAVVARLREALGRTPMGAAMDCFDCVSLWVAAPFALFVGPVAGEPPIPSGAVCWLALAGAAALLEHATRARGAPIVIERPAAPAEEEWAHGLLQSAPSGGFRITPGTDTGRRIDA